MLKRILYFDNSDAVNEDATFVANYVWKQVEREVQEGLHNRSRRDSSEVKMLNNVCCFVKVIEYLFHMYFIDYFVI